MLPPVPSRPSTPVSSLRTRVCGAHLACSPSADRISFSANKENRDLNALAFASQGNPEILQACLRHPEVNHDVLAAVLYNSEGNREVLTSLVTHRLTNRPLLENILVRSNADLGVVDAVLKHSLCNDDLLGWVLKYSEGKPDVLTRLLKHPLVDYHMLLRIVEQSQGEAAVLVGVLGHQLIEDKLWRPLLDETPQNKITTGTYIHKYLPEVRKVLSEVLEKARGKHEILLMLVRHRVFADTWWGTVSETLTTAIEHSQGDPTTLLAIAAHPGVDSGILLKILSAGRGNEEILQMALKHPATDGYVLQLMSMQNAKAPQNLIKILEHPLMDQHSAETVAYYASGSQDVLDAIAQKYPALESRPSAPILF